MSDVVGTALPRQLLANPVPHLVLYEPAVMFDDTHVRLAANTDEETHNTRPTARRPVAIVRAIEHLRRTCNLFSQKLNQLFQAGI